MIWKILTVLLGLSVLSDASGLAQEWPEGTFTYTMKHDSQGDIGIVTIISKRIGDTIFVKTTEKVDVSKFGIAIYHSKAERWEKWYNGQLVSFKSITNESCSGAGNLISSFKSLFGSHKICVYDHYTMPMEVRAWLTDDGMIIQGASLRDQKAPCTHALSRILTVNFLNPELVKQSQPVLLIDSTTGKQKERNIEPASESSTTQSIPGGTLQYLYKGSPGISGDPTRELWYDENGIWAGLHVEENNVSIIRQSVVQQNAISPEEWEVPKSDEGC